MPNQLKCLLLLLFFTFSVYVSGQSNNKITNIKLSNEEAKTVIDSLTNRCWALREKNSDSALIIGEEALKIALEKNLSKNLARIYGFIGVIYIHYLYDTKRSIPYFHKAMEYSMKNNDSVEIAFSYNNLGDAFLKTGNIPLALQYSEKSLEIFQKIKHQKGIAYGYVNMGLVYSHESKYHLALEYFVKAKEIREKTNDKTGLASVTLEIAKVYKEEGHLDQALEQYQNSLNSHIAINNTTYTAYCLNGMASVYYKKGDYEKAREKYSEAIDLDLKKQHFYGLISDYIGLALVYAKQNKVEEGENVLNKALSLSTKLSLHSSILQTHKTFSQFYQLVNDYKKATKSFNKFIKIYDSVLSVQQFEILNELQNNYLIRQDLLKIEQDLTTQKLEQKYLFILIVLIFFVAVIILWRFLVQKKMSKKLQESNMVKDKLFSVVSHDLRSPFNSLLGFSELLLRDLKNNNYTDVKYYSSIIYSSSSQTLKLLNNLLSWSQTQTGNFKFNPENFSIKLLFEDLSEFFNVDSVTIGIDINFECLIEKEIVGDPNILRIIIINLITNAIKYSKKNDAINVRAYNLKSEIIFEVEDTGTGMNEETLQQLFNSSKPAKSIEGVRNIKGTGLGLIICFELIKLQKGSISAESILGKGSTFRIKIPNNLKK